MALKTVKKDKLKDAVNKHKDNLPETTVFVVGARPIKNGQVEVEFAQNRNLAGRRANLLALLNEGDERFNNGKTLMRVWTMVNALGFTKLFGKLDGIDFNDVVEACKEADDDQRVAILKPVATINIDGVQKAVKIVCRETVSMDELPKSIRENLKDPEVSDEIKDRYILQTGGKDSTKIVDEFGNTVYRTFSLGLGDEEDILVANKQLASDYKEKSKSAKKSTTSSSALSAIEGDLVG